MKWAVLKTPAALVDRDRVESNTHAMSERVAALGARLRPHVKTHKCVEAARLQVRDHFGGITVSTLAEARFFADAGFRDVTYAVPIAHSRLEEARDLARRMDHLHLLLDHEATLRAMEDCARASGLVLSAFLKVDCGYHRAGVDPESEDGVKLALDMARSEHVEFRGILTHAGHAYHGKTPAEVRAVAAQERSVMVRFAGRLAAAGAAPPEVSVGSTPTMTQAESLEGVTEARPGNYVFFDRFQSAVGSCSSRDVAYSVLASVLGHYPEQNEVLIDAGALALSKDPGPTHVDSDCGFGSVYDAASGEALEGVSLVSLSQEHGKLRATRPGSLDRVRVGSKLRIVPNHSCLSAALFDRYHVIRGDSIVDEWRPVRGW